MSNTDNDDALSTGAVVMTESPVAAATAAAAGAAGTAPAAVPAAPAVPVDLAALKLQLQHEIVGKMKLEMMDILKSTLEAHKQEIEDLLARQAAGLFSRLFKSLTCRSV